MDSSLRTAAQQALEVLENAVEYDYHGTPLTETHAGFNDAATALKAALLEDAMQRFSEVNQELEAALAEPVEPVAWMFVDDTGMKFVSVDRPHKHCQPLYTAPPQRPAEPVQDVKGCDHCNHPMYCAIKCKVCGRVTEPVQEPYAWMSVGGSIWRHKTREDDVPLYTAPRKPLAEWQINDLMSDIDPEDRDSWSFRQGVYAAEKHHGIRR